MHWIPNVFPDQIDCVESIPQRLRRVGVSSDACLGTSTIAWMRSVNQNSLACRVGSRDYPYREGVGEGTERRRSGSSVPRVIRKTGGKRSTRMSETGRACV